MSTKNICLALAALALTAGFGTVAEAQRSAIAPAACSTSYSTETGTDGRAVSVATLTCSRPAQRFANGAAL